MSLHFASIYFNVTRFVPQYMYLMTSHRYYSREASNSFSTFRTQLKSTQLIKKVSQQLPETVVTTVITYLNMALRLVAMASSMVTSFLGSVEVVVKEDWEELSEKASVRPLHRDPAMTYSRAGNTQHDQFTARK